MPATPRIVSATIGALVAASALAISVGPASTQDAPFGQEADVRYAEQLWQQLVAARMAGANAIQTMPYEGTPPHGPQLGLLETDLEVEGHTGLVIVKRNFRPEGEGELTREDVLQGSVDEYLESSTVMYRREEGYDPENANWFWVKYNADGSLQQNEAGLPLAGRVAKGADQGCIACHSAAPGGDYVFSYDLGQ